MDEGIWGRPTDYETTSNTAIFRDNNMETQPHKANHNENHAAHTHAAHCVTTIM